ncbi:hypothetical protein BR93DRAFT_617336 [Coniochaeta sp. PMI_546]|nr:hypothetical protein BR93DRAFT_617336 [Coniochaeta sp. PMI_546]
MSMSTRSGASGASGRQTLPDKKPDRAGEPASPDSPLRSAGPLTRKRAASLRTEGPRIEDLSLNTPTADTSPPQLLESGRDLICLCTPAPKVPRPRNGMSSFFFFLSSLLPRVFCRFSGPLFVLQTHISEVSPVVLELRVSSSFLYPVVSHQTSLRLVTGENKKEREQHYLAARRHKSNYRPHLHLY